MLYLFLGKLCGYLCDECLEALSDATVRLYRLRRPKMWPTWWPHRPSIRLML